MGANCTAIGMDAQPHSVGRSCYRIRMLPSGPKDITTFLWTNIVDRVGVPAGTTQTVWNTLKKRGKNVPRGNLQRIEEGGLPTTKSLVVIAKALGVEVWELLVPPGGASQAKSSAGCGLDDAVGTISESLGKLAPTKRGLVLQHLALYVEDPSNETSSLEFVLNSLGGARDQPAMLRHAS